MSFLISSKSVLIMNDDGLQVFLVNKKSAKFIDLIKWDQHEFEDVVKKILLKQCHSSPVIILNDMVEQHYRKEKIPKVSFFDKNNVLNRRLGLAFPNYNVRAAMKLKDGKDGEPNGQSYLFSAIASSSQYQKTISAVQKSTVTIKGLFLLPIEASVMINTLLGKLYKNNKIKSQTVWAIFLGQSNGGSLRQIVTKNGDLALTRMTPIIDTDIETGLWCQEVVAELNATMSYLTRFGYKNNDHLDVIIVANENSKSILEKTINIDCELVILNSEELAHKLGYRVQDQDDLRYAYPVYAAFLGNQRSLLLPLKSSSLDRLEKPQKIASVITLALMVGCAYFGYVAFNNFKNTQDYKNQLMAVEEQSRSLQTEYEIELEKKKQIGFDFVLVNNSIDIYNELEKENIDVIPFMETIGKALGVDVYLDSLTVESVDPVEGSYDPYSNEPPPPKRIKFVLFLSFPGTMLPEVGVGRVNRIRENLSAAMQGYEVNVAKQVADLSYTEDFSGQSGGGSSEQTKDYTAQIEIVGPIK